jgi:O-antigen/teichoic acid export membrane protein
MSPNAAPLDESADRRRRGPIELIRRVVRSSELRPIFVSTFGEGGSRAVNFLFYLAVARALSPAGFGEVRYTITLATVALCLTQVLSNAMNRELGAARLDLARTREVLGSALAVGVALWLGSVALCVLASAASLTGTASALGLVAALSGLTVFQLYYAAARGLGAAERAAVIYFGTAVVNLGAFLAVWALTTPTPTIALVIFGTSSVVPILVAELARPVVAKAGLRVARRPLPGLWRIGGPLILAQIGYLTWVSADQIWVETQLGSHEIGLYSAARNLSILLLVIPAGVAGVLAPRVAELLSARREDRAARLLRLVSVAATLAVGALATVLILAREELLTFLYGDEYGAAAPALVGLCVSAVAYTAFAVVANGAVGWGRPRVYAAGVAVAACVEVVALLVTDSTSASTAAWSSAGGIFAALLVILGWLRLRPLPTRTGGRPNGWGG